MAIIAQISVIKTNTTSNRANTLFLNPNWIGVNAALKRRFKRNGRNTRKGICFWYAKIKTLPNEIAIRMYRIAHTGPKRKAGGAQKGFCSCLYHSYALSIFSLVLSIY